jgi:hypothetical protein
MSNFDDRNSTVRWMPRWARNLLGLNADYERPAYDRYSTDRNRMAEEGVGWIPGFVRSWLGLDFKEPTRYGPSSVYDPVEGRLVSGPGSSNAPAAPAPRPQVATPRTPPPPSPAPAPAPTYRPAQPTSSSSSGLTFRREPSGSSAQSSPSQLGKNGDGSGSVSPGANLPEGYVQPIGYLFRSYARGALPPEGLEALTKQSRKTVSDVWDFYSYWLRFQGEELGRLGKEAVDAVGEALPSATPSQPAIRRIRVATNGDGNGNGNGTPAAAPPAPTAAETPEKPEESEK